MLSFLWTSAERLNLAREGAAHLQAGLLHGTSHLATRGMGWKQRKVNSCLDQCSDRAELSHLDGADSAGGAAL